MKSYNLIIAGLILVVSSCSNEEASSTEATNADSNKIESKSNAEAIGIPEGSYFLTKEKHTITWDVTKITGSSHSGIMKSENGKFTVENGAISRGILLSLIHI